MPVRTILRFAIETDAEADVQRDKLVDRLARSSPARKAIAACDDDDPCDLSACPLCGHRFRKVALPQLVPLFRQPLDQLRFVTMYVQAIGQGELAEVDSLTAKDSLRKVVARADIPGRGLAVGALEPEWLGAERKWLIHLHVVASEIDEKCWDRIRAVLKKRANKQLFDATRPQARRVLRIDPVEDLARQLSYCIKFVTYDHLPRGENGAKGKAVPLAGKPLEELVAWRSRYSPSDFLFLYDAKRLNGKFVRTPRSA
jgi:hypothetical protein